MNFKFCGEKNKTKYKTVSEIKWEDRHWFWKSPLKSKILRAQTRQKSKSAVN